MLCEISVSSLSCATTCHITPPRTAVGPHPFSTHNRFPVCFVPLAVLAPTFALCHNPHACLFDAWFGLLCVSVKQHRHTSQPPPPLAVHRAASAATNSVLSLTRSPRRFRVSVGAIGQHEIDQFPCGLQSHPLIYCACTRG
jgi:hypothetical protein